MEVAKLYDTMLDAKQITPEQYRTWGAFAKTFQRDYPVAVVAWKTARATNDPAGLQAIEARMGPMLHELSAMAQALYTRGEALMPIVALLLPLLPVLIQSALTIIAAIRHATDVPSATVAQLDAIAAKLDDTMAAVRAVVIRDV